MRPVKYPGPAEQLDSIKFIKFLFTLQLLYFNIVRLSHLLCHEDDVTMHMSPMFCEENLGCSATLIQQLPVFGKEFIASKIHSQDPNENGPYSSFLDSLDLR